MLNKIWNGIVRTVTNLWNGFARFMKKENEEGVPNYLFVGLIVGFIILSIIRISMDMNI